MKNTLPSKSRASSQPAGSGSSELSRRFPPLSHGIASGMVSGLEPSLPCLVSPPTREKKQSGSSLQHYNEPFTASLSNLECNGEEKKSFRRAPSVLPGTEKQQAAHRRLIHGSCRSEFPPLTNTTRALSPSSVLHVRLLHHISFLRVHIGAGADLHNRSDVRLDEPPGPMGGLGSTQLKTFVKKKCVWMFGLSGRPESSVRV